MYQNAESNLHFLNPYREIGFQFNCPCPLPGLIAIAIRNSPKTPLKIFPGNPIHTKKSPKALIHVYYPNYLGIP